MAAVEDVDIEAMESDIISEFITMGHDTGYVIRALKDVNLRIKWGIGSQCLIYSRSSKQWCDGQIVCSPLVVFL